MREKSWNCCAEIQLHTISEWEILLLAVKAIVILTNLAKYWARLKKVKVTWPRDIPITQVLGKFYPE